MKKRSITPAMIVAHANGKVAISSVLMAVWFLLPSIFSVTLPSTAHGLPHQSQEFAIASPSPYAATVAAEISSLGGNLFDQAVAVALSMAVTHPYYASLGGGGFAVIRKQNSDAAATVEVLDFREVAPMTAGRDLFAGRDVKAATDGGLASGVPGVPAGLFDLHVKYGKLPWKKLFGPAIRLAEKGFPVSGEWAAQTKNQFEAFNGFGKKIFGRTVLDKMKPPRERFEPLVAGDTLKQPLLAKGLRLLRDQGPKAFYEGPIAKDIVDVIGQTGGIISLEDMKAYRAVWRQPLRRTWRGYDLSLMPPPSSGGLIIAQALELVDRIEAKHGVSSSLSSQEAHVWGEALKLAFASRGQMGDPMKTLSMTDLTARLLAPDRLDRLAKLFQKEVAIKVKTSKSADLKEAMAPVTNKEKTETTHFSIADKNGNAVSFTVTVNGSYGSGIVSGKFGIALNDEMDDFATQPGQPNQYGLIQGEANAVGPGKRPLSSMSPTIVEKDGRFVAALGAPGGPRIPSAVFQVLIRTLAQSLDAEEAVHLPRVHHQFLPDTLFFDARKFSPDVTNKLKNFGHATQEAWIAKTYLVKMNSEGLLEAAADPRGEAAVGGR